MLTTFGTAGKQQQQQQQALMDIYLYFKPDHQLLVFCCSLVTATAWPCCPVPSTSGTSLAFLKALSFGSKETTSLACSCQVTRCECSCVALVQHTVVAGLAAMLPKLPRATRSTSSLCLCRVASFAVPPLPGIFHTPSSREIHQQPTCACDQGFIPQLILDISSSCAAC